MTGVQTCALPIYDADSEFNSDCDVDVDSLSEVETEFDSDCEADVDSLSEIETEFDSDT